MAVVPLTLAISLLLVGTFIVFFLREHARGASSSPERDSLLPLEEETPCEKWRDHKTTDHGTRTKLQHPTAKLQ